MLNKKTRIHTSSLGEGELLLMLRIIVSNIHSHFCFFVCSICIINSVRQKLNLNLTWLTELTFLK